MSFAKYFIKKPIGELHEEIPTEYSLKRVLGPINLVNIGVGSIIGAGIFVLTGTAAATHAGPAIVLSFILGGIVCAFAGLCYSELASLIPISGSAYSYAYATLGELIAWIIGWDLILEYTLGSATVAVGWGGYVVSLLKDLHLVIPPQFTAPLGAKLADGTTGFFNLPAFLIVMAITVLLVIGIRESAKFNNAIVFVKLLVIFAFLFFGVSHINFANWYPFIPKNTGKMGDFGPSGVVTGAAVVFFSYIGFDAVSTAAQEAKNPRRDMPIGILGSLFFCTLLYILVSGTLTGVVNYHDLNVPDPIAVGVNKIGMPWLALLVKIGAILGLSSVILVLFYGQTRVSYAMALDGLMPKFLGKVHKRFHTPYITTIIFGFLIAFAAALTPIGKLGEMVSIGTLFAFIIVCAGVIYLRMKQPDLPRAFRCPLVPWVPIGGIVSSLYLMSGLPLDTWMRLIIWLIIGLVIYFTYGHKNTKAGVIT